MTTPGAASVNTWDLTWLMWWSEEQRAKWREAIEAPHRSPPPLGDPISTYVFLVDARTPKPRYVAGLRGHNVGT